MEWSGAEWGGVEWIGAEWGGVELSGVEWNGVERSGVEWNGVEWGGVELSGLEWSGVERSGWSGVEWTHRGVVDDMCMRHATFLNETLTNTPTQSVCTCRLPPTLMSSQTFDPSISLTLRELRF